MGTWCSNTVMVYYGSLKQLSIIIRQKNLVPWCIDNVIFLNGIFKWPRVIINMDIWNKNFFWVCFGCRFVLNDDRRSILSSTNFSIMCLCSECFFTTDVSVFIQLVITIKGLKMMKKIKWYCQVNFCFFWVFDIGQFHRPWLMSNDLFLQILELWYFVGNFEIGRINILCWIFWWIS